ncbi:MAG: STAS domain-containing protein [Bacteroidales bacterium]|jgi:anti-anti-sigma factor|nr:STAS domain-containing protein [Bacteroidales bacterium]
MREIFANILAVEREGLKVSASFMDTNKLTALNIKLVKQILVKLITRRGTQLELDMSGIRFIDSSGFDTLNLIHQLGKKYNSTFVLTGVEMEVLDMMDLLRKYHIFHIHQVTPAC